tara:strand:+ start:353 stop:571 length:219 start_codon:yes stop_codon:yes gene_type:complete
MPPKPKKKNGNGDPYKNLKEGAFSKQAKAAGYTSLDTYANYIIKNYKDKKSNYNPSLTTYRRALFYNNLVKK